MLTFITIIILSSIIIHIIWLQQCRNQLFFPDMASVGNYFKKLFVSHYCFDHWLIEFFRQLLSVFLDECLFLFSLTYFFCHPVFKKPFIFTIEIYFCVFPFRVFDTLVFIIVKAFTLHAWNYLRMCVEIPLYVNIILLYFIINTLALLLSFILIYSSSSSSSWGKGKNFQGSFGFCSSNSWQYILFCLLLW